MDFLHAAGTIHQVQGGALYGPFFSVSGQNSSWTKHIVPLGMFSNLETKNSQTPEIVFKYTSGSTFRSDVQLDDMKLGNCYRSNSYYGDQTFTHDTTNQLGSSYFLTTTSNTSNFFSGSASWTNVATATTAGRWNRDCSGTPSGSTGLSTGNSGSCYLYVETSGFNNSTAWLRQKIWGHQFGYYNNIIVLTPNSYFEFYEARYGSAIGTLEMYVYVPDDDYF